MAGYVPAFMCYQCFWWLKMYIKMESNFGDGFWSVCRMGIWPGAYLQVFSRTLFVKMTCRMLHIVETKIGPRAARYRPRAQNGRVFIVISSSWYVSCRTLKRKWTHEKWWTQTFSSCTVNDGRVQQITSRLCMSFFSNLPSECREVIVCGLWGCAKYG